MQTRHAVMGATLLAAAFSNAAARNPALLQLDPLPDTSGRAFILSPDGKAIVDGDVVEVRGGEVFLNGVSFGRTAPGSTVKYTKRNGERRLVVGGTERGPLTRLAAPERRTPPPVDSSTAR